MVLIQSGLEDFGVVVLSLNKRLTSDIILTSLLRRVEDNVVGTTTRTSTNEAIGHTRRGGFYGQKYDRRACHRELRNRGQRPTSCRSQRASCRARGSSSRNPVYTISAWLMVLGKPSRMKPFLQAGAFKLFLMRSTRMSSLTSLPASMAALARLPTSEPRTDNEGELEGSQIPLATASRSISPVERWQTQYSSLMRGD